MSVGSIITPSKLSVYQTNTAPLPGGPAPAPSPQGTAVPPAPGASTGGANLNLRAAPQGQAATDPAASAAAFSSALSQLPAASSTRDFLARLMIEQAADQRKQALSDRLATREMAKAELLAQAGTLQDQASELMKGAITSLVLTVVSSAVTIAVSALSVAASFASLGKAGSATSSVGQATTKGVDEVGEAVGEVATKSVDTAMKAAEKLQGISQSLSSIAKSVESLGSGSAGAASSITQSNAKQDEADGAVHAAKAQEQQSLGELRKSAEDALSETMKQLIQFLKDMADSKAEQMRAMTRV